MDEHRQIRQPILDVIDAFVELIPSAEFGFAHIVLSDYNLSNHNIEFCLDEDLRKRFYDDDKRDGEDDAHLMAKEAAVVGFLVWLRNVPEEIREAAMVDYHGVDDDSD